jgi:O-antigen ligase
VDSSKGSVRIDWDIWILCFFAFAVSFYPNLAVVSLCAVFLFWRGLWNPLILFYCWILMYPLYYKLSVAVGFPSYVLLAPLPVMSLSMLAIRSSIGVGLHRPVMLSGLFLALGAVSGFISISGGLVGARDAIYSILMLAAGLLSLIGAASVVVARDVRRFHLNNVFVLAASLAVIAAAIQFQGSARFNIEGNVRKLANILSIGVVLILISILQGGARASKWWRVSLLVVLTMSLTSTLSRGAIMATAVTASVVVFGHLAWSRKKKLGLILAGCGCAVVAFLVTVIFDQYITGGYARRLTDNPGQVSQNVRWEIWGATWNQLDVVEKIIGSGPGSFLDNAAGAGFDRYSHSVFADAFVTMGILGGTGLVAVLCWLVFSAWRARNIYGLSFSVLGITLFITHGSLTGSLDFWVLVGLAVGFLASNRPDRTIGCFDPDRRSRLPRFKA